MKKLIIFAFLFLFLFSYVSAVRVDYSPNDKGIKDMKAVVKDTILFGLISVGEQGTMELKSHDTIYEKRGVEINTLTKEVNPAGIGLIYETNFGNEHKEALTDVKIIDMKTGKEVERDWRFVYSSEGQWEIPIYKEVCSKEEQLKEEYEKNCDWVFDYYEYSPRKIWNVYDNNNIPKGKFELGIEIEVKEGDYLDIILEVQGKGIDKHAQVIEGIAEYTYAVGSGNQSVVKYDKDFNIVAVSPNYGGIIRSISLDDDYVYYCGDTTQTVRKAYKTNLTTITDSPNYGGNLYSISLDDDYVYYGGTSTQTVRKAYKSNLTTITDSPIYGGSIISISLDDDYVYYSGTNIGTVRKAYKSNLTTITNSPNSGGSIYSLSLDDDYVYYGVDSTRTVRKAYKSNLNTITDSPSYGGTINSISLDDDYVYYGGTSTQTVRKAYKSNLNTITDSPSYGGNIYSISLDDDYVYYGGFTTQTVRKAYKSNLTTITDSPNYGGIIFSISLEAPQFLEISLISPTNYYNSSSSTIDFSANLTDEIDLGIQNVSLVINDTVYDTNTSGLTGVYNFSETLSDGFYEWYIEAYDDNDEVYESETRYFTIDTTPFIEFVSPTPANASNLSVPYIPVNVTVTEDYFENITFYFYKGGVLNETVTFTDDTRFYNKTGCTCDNWEINVTVCTTTGKCNSTETRLLIIDILAPEIEILSPVTSYNYLQPNQTIDLNVTVTDASDHLDSCWYEYNSSIIYFNCSENQTFNYIPDQNTLTVYANDTFGNEGSESVSWATLFNQLNLTYEEEVYEGVQNTFEVDMLLDGSLQQAYLQYNQTNYTTGVSYSGGIYSISSTIISPLVDNDTNLTFSFWFRVDDVWYNLLSNNQSVLGLYFGSCSPGNTVMLNISLLDERLQTSINGTIEFNGYLTNKLTSQVVQSTNLSFNNVNLAQVCLNPLEAYDNYYLYSEMRYYKTGTHVPELYNIDKADLGNYPKNMSLYDLGTNESTEFLITYKDNNFIKVEGAIIQLQRKYIAEDSYKVVEAPKTSSSGTAVVHVDLDSILYKAVVVKDGIVLDTFDNIVFHCENLFSGVCNQELKGEVDPENIIEVEDLEDFSYTITEEDNTINLQYSIPSGTSSDINIIMTQKDSYGNITLCNQSIISSGGSLECDYTDSITQSYITFEVLKDDELIDYRTYVIRGSEEINFLNNNYFIVVLLLLSLVGMAFTSPEWTIILSILTFLLAGGLYLLNGLNFVTGIGGLIWLVISAVIIITKLSQQEDR